MGKINTVSRSEMCRKGYLSATVIARVLGISTSTVYNRVDMGDRYGAGARRWKGVRTESEWYVLAGPILEDLKSKVAALEAALAYPSRSVQRNP